MKLLANTLEGLKFGLKNFDAVEFDIRITKEQGLVIFHDPDTVNGQRIRDMTLKQLEKINAPSLEKFLEDPAVSKLMQSGKKLFVEFKQNCRGRKPTYEKIAQIMHDEFIRIVDKTSSPIDSLKVISFQRGFFPPFLKDEIFDIYPLLPYVNECYDKLKIIKALPSVIGISLKKQMRKAQEDGYKGLLLARQYLMGPISVFHPSYDELCDLMDETGIELGTNLGEIQYEDKFPRFHRFSDKTHQYPRLAKKGEGLIIAHRGTGTNGVEI